LSLETWQQEFYPVHAKVAAQSAATTKDVILSSINKWKGLRKANIEKHELVLDSYGVLRDLKTQQRAVMIGSNNCSLCLKFQTQYTGCRSCPIYLMQGFSCYNSRPEDGKEHMDSAYNLYLKPGGDPEPIIKLLTDTYNWQPNDELLSKPFELNATYRTKGGELVKIIEVSTHLPGYECVKGEDDIWRYNRPNDRGRVTASAHDMSDPRNLIPEPINDGLNSLKSLQESMNIE
jgi:hypothetical protein